MLVEVKCPIQGTITADVNFPHYFFKEHKPYTDENQVFSFITGVILEDVCFTVTVSYNEHQQPCTVMGSESYNSIAESKAKNFCNPLYQSTKEEFHKQLENAQRWFSMQQKTLAVLSAFPLS